MRSGWQSLLSPGAPTQLCQKQTLNSTKPRQTAFEVFPLVRVGLEIGSWFALGGVRQVGCGANDLLLLFPFWISSFL